MRLGTILLFFFFGLVLLSFLGLIISGTRVSFSLGILLEKIEKIIADSERQGGNP